MIFFMISGRRGVRARLVHQVIPALPVPQVLLQVQVRAHNLLAAAAVPLAAAAVAVKRTALERKRRKRRRRRRAKGR